MESDLLELARLVLDIEDMHAYHHEDDSVPYFACCGSMFRHAEHCRLELARRKARELLGHGGPKGTTGEK